MDRPVSDDKALPALIRLVGLAFGVPQVAGAAVDAIQVSKWISRHVAPGRKEDVQSKLLRAGRAALSSYSDELRALPANEWDAAEFALAKAVRKIEPDRLVISAVINRADLRRELTHGSGAPLRQKLFSEQATAIYDALAASLLQCLADVYADDKAFLYATQRLLATEIERLHHSKTASENDLSASYREYTGLYLRSALNAVADVSITSPEVRSDRRSYPRARLGIQARVLEAGSVRSRPLSSQTLRTADSIYAVTGSAGSGKTTVLKALVAELSQRRIATRSPSDHLPLYLDATAPGARPSQQHLEEIVEATAGGKPPDRWLQAHLETGRFVLLVDGLDLLERSTAGTYLQWVEGLRQLHGRRGLRILYATRASQYLHRAEPRAHALALSPLNADERGRLARNLFEHVYDATAHDATTFMERLETDRAGRLVASNPLMLTLICSLHDEISLSQSEERAEMFDILARALSLSDAPLSTSDQDAAGALAILSLERPDAAIDRRRAIRHLREQPSCDGHDAAEVIERLIQRSGHLELDGAMLRFRFDALREYLAAQALGRMGMPAIAHLLSSAQDLDRWKAIVIWLAHILGADDRAQLVDLVGSTPAASALPAPAALALAHGTDRVESDLVRRASDQLIPPRVSSSLSAVSELGDLAVTYLRPSLTSADAEDRARAIDALILIGTPHAIATLTALGEAASAHAWQLLAGVNVWASLEYARTLMDLASDHGAKTPALHLTNTRLIHCIDQLPPTAKLFLHLDFGVDVRPWEFAELRPLRRTIEAVHIRNGSTSDLVSVAQYFPGARSVTLEDADLSTANELPSGMHLPQTLRLVTTERTVRHSVGWDALLRALADSTGLERLSLSGGRTQYESLNGLDSLRHLDLTDVGLSGFELKLARLQSLSMVAGDLEDFLPIESCRDLKSVSVASMSALASCEGIQALPHLTSVTISECRDLVDVSALAEIARDLTELTIAGCPNVDLSLSGLTDFQFDMDDDAGDGEPGNGPVDQYDYSDEGDTRESNGVKESDGLEPSNLQQILLTFVPTRLRGHDQLANGPKLDPVDRTAAEERAKELRRLVDERMTGDEMTELSRLMWLGAR